MSASYRLFAFLVVFCWSHFDVTGTTVQMVSTEETSEMNSNGHPISLTSQTPMDITGNPNSTQIQDVNRHRGAVALKTSTSQEGTSDPHTAIPTARTVPSSNNMSNQNIPSTLTLPPNFISISQKLTTEVLLPTTTILTKQERKRLFLGGIKNKKVRKVTKKYLQLCPYTPLCNISFSRSSTSCCDPCECGVDCPHELEKLPSYIQQIYACQTATAFHNESDDRSENGYKFEIVCEKEVTFLAYLCNEPYENRGGSLTLVDTIPVTDINTNLTYRNYHCARCVGLNRDDVIPWKQNLTCLSPFSPGLNLQPENVLSLARTDPRCYLESVPSELILPHVSECNMRFIDTCNKTGLWENYDDLIARACSAFHSRYIGDKYTYKNVFCAQCNGQEIAKKCFPSLANVVPRSSFSDLLDFTWHDEESQRIIVLAEDDKIANNPQRCQSGEIHAHFMDICLMLGCQSFSYLVKEACIPESPITIPIRHEVLLKVSPSREITVLEAMDIDITSHIKDQLILPVCSIVMFVKADIPFKANIASTKLEQSKIKHFIVKLVLDIEPLILNVDQIFPEGLSPMMCQGQTISLHVQIELSDSYFFPKHSSTDSGIGIRRKVCFSVNQQGDVQNITEGYHFSERLTLKRDPHDNRTIFKMKSMHSPTNCPDNIVVVMPQRLECTLVKLTRRQFQYKETQNGIYIPIMMWNLSYKDYLADDELSIRLCKDQYIAKAKSLISMSPHDEGSDDRKPSEFFSVEIILGLLCTGVSILCLVFSFAVYCILSELRTLPGKLNMMLILSLLSAQAFFLVMSFGYNNMTDWLCKTVGIMVHFWWLSTLCWMGVCCVHMFRVFIRSKRPQMGDNRYQFVVYTILVNMISIAFVVSVIVVSIILSDGTSIGYGDRVCYISSPWMVLYAFAVPVGVIVVGNIVIFVAVVIKIRLMSAIERNVRNDRNEVIVFAKLSTITGATWLFGFIYQWTDLPVFSYLFIIFNAGQGVFLMLSFIFNRRTLRKLRGKLSRTPVKTCTAARSRDGHSATVSTVENSL